MCTNDPICDTSQELDCGTMVACSVFGSHGSGVVLSTEGVLRTSNDNTYSSMFSKCFEKVQVIASV